MFALAWSNLTHHKLRAALSALAVGIGIMLLLISRGLANGSINEVNDRMQSVDAEIVILPAQDNIIFTNGAPFRGLHERFLHKISDEQGPLAADVIPVLFGQVRMGGQQQRLFGIDPAQMDVFLGSRRVLQGQAFDHAQDFAKRIDAEDPQTPRDTPLAERLAGGLELVIDERLQRVGEYKLGDTIPIMGQNFSIVGIIETGVAGRVFAPLQTLREIVVAGEPHASMYFIRLRHGLDPSAALERFAAELDARVELKSDYGRLLRESFASVNLYMTASSGVALVACFLFILLTMYTVVVERSREIAILKSLGVSRLGLLRLSVAEALLISLGGVAVGVGLALLGKLVIGVVAPLLTVDLSGSGLLVAVIIGVVGGTLSALYPGYRAARLEPALVLGNE